MLTPRFPHLNLINKFRGVAKLGGGGKADPIVEKNLNERARHTQYLTDQIGQFSRNAIEVQRARAQEELPTIGSGVSFMLQIPDEDDDAIEFVAEKLGLEIVAEFDDGYLIVATADIDLSEVLTLISDFSASKFGSGRIAKIKEIDPDPFSDRRLNRILDETLKEIWPFPDEKEFTLDVSIEAAAFGVPKKPIFRRGTDDETRERELREFDEAKDRFLQEWDDVKRRREDEIEEFQKHYSGEILEITDESHRIEFPDSFSMRIKMSGKGFKDLILNYPNLFEVTVPDDVVGFQPPELDGDDGPNFQLAAPSADAPTICVIDSGIQENHLWLREAIDVAFSRAFIPGIDITDVADYVRAGGHGTRVAGAALYPIIIPRSDEHQAPFWILNARVLNADNVLIQEIYPPKLLCDVTDFYLTERNTRIYVHSINSRRCSRVNRMSAWASAMDLLSHEKDVLFIQSVGNISDSTNSLNNPGILNHIKAGRIYPRYFREGSARIANPAQSLQAISVGSVSNDFYEDENFRSIAASQRPSSFSRPGFGLWDSIKPDVVEYGGDYAISHEFPATLTTPAAVCPELIRSTLYGGPPFAQDNIGTSFAAPKVAHIAGHLQSLFPDRKTLLYRALIINSARWPKWAEDKRNDRPHDRPLILKSMGYGIPSLERAISNQDSRVTLITDSEYEIKAKEGFVFGVPIPEALRTAGDAFDVRIDVTLSYSAKPRRTRKGRRGYLGVWLDWRSSKKSESFESFCARVLKDSSEGESSTEANFPWKLGNKRDNDGVTNGVTRKNGTVQKDWTIAQSYELPEMFGIVVRGHEGWERSNENATATFSLVVSFEALGTEVRVYEEIRQAIEIETRAEAIIR